MDEDMLIFSSSPSSKENPKQVFICSEKGCNSRFSKKSYLEQHMCIHTSERPFVCPNKDCKKSYKRKDHLNRHAKLCPSLLLNESTVFPCTVEGCEHKSQSSDCLRKHIRSSHVTKKKTFPCLFEGCSETFKKHQELRAHKFDHTQKNPFECPHPGCEMSFRWPNRLKRHMKIHDGYKCPECEETFEKWTLLLKHKSSAHQMQQTCPICKKIFSHRHRLKIHMKIHSEDREVYECPREGCGRYYSEKRNLDAHIRSYHEGQRFACTHESCDRTFAFKHKMHEHLKSHSITGKIKKKYPKKGHRRKNVALLLTGIEDVAIAKGSVDSKDLLCSSSNETESVSKLPSCDWGGSQEILDVDNSSKVKEDNSCTQETLRGNSNDSNTPQPAEGSVQANTKDIEDKDISSGNRKKDSSLVQNYENNIPTINSQIHLSTTVSSDASLLTKTETNSSYKTTKSIRIQKNHSMPASFLNKHVKCPQTPQLISVIEEDVGDKFQESNHSLKREVECCSENANSKTGQYILSNKQKLTDRPFKHASSLQSFGCKSPSREHQKKHTTEPQSFRCPRKKCLKVYTVQRKLDLHLQCDHDGLGFQCMYANCGMVFDSQRSLEKHFNLHNVKITHKQKEKLTQIISEFSH